MRLAAAALVAAAVGAIGWFELVYLYFGVAGEDPPAIYNALSALAAFGAAATWALHGAHRPARVVQRGCGAGIAVSLLLPAVAFAVLLLWQAAPARRDLGMGGLMLYAMPVVAFVAGAVMAVLFALAGKVAGRRLAKEPDRPAPP